MLYFGFYRGSLNLGWVYDNYVPLMTASILFSTALTLYLYATSYAKGAVLAQGGNTGYWLYDMFIGRELNPRIGGFDLKEFCELYPGMPPPLPRMHACSRSRSQLEATGREAAC